jgi:cell fate regulator YaaT (PSP1 superfamily)
LSRYYEETVKVVTVDEKKANLEWNTEKRKYKLPNKIIKDKLMEKQHTLGLFEVKLMVEKIKEAGY